MRYRATLWSHRGLSCSPHYGGVNIALIFLCMFFRGEVLENPEPGFILAPRTASMLITMCVCVFPQVWWTTVRCLATPLSSTGVSARCSTTSNSISGSSLKVNQPEPLEINYRYHLSSLIAYLSWRRQCPGLCSLESRMFTSEKKTSLAISYL